MSIQDPRQLMEQIDPARWESLKGRGSLQATKGEEPHYLEPFCSEAPACVQSGLPVVTERVLVNPAGDLAQTNGLEAISSISNDSTKLISGKVQRLGDFIDTDAVCIHPVGTIVLHADEMQLAPAQYLVESRTNEAIGSHCLEFTHPDFRARVRDGYDIVVAGKAFGCGSSREQAVSALLGKSRIRMQMVAETMPKD